jgi:hypothetical protein
MVICSLCGLTGKHLASHISRVHGLTKSTYNGTIVDDDVKIRMRLGSVGKKRPDICGKLNPMYRPEVREKVALSLRGRSKLTHEHVRIQAQKMIGRTKFNDIGKFVASVKISQALRGRSKETHPYLVEQSMRRAVSMRHYWRVMRFEHPDRVSEIRRKQLAKSFPNRFENAMMNFLIKYGDAAWQLNLCRRIIEGHAPDFINPVSHKIILCHGTFYHTKVGTNRGLSKRDVERRDIGFYRNNGFDARIVWDDEFPYTRAGYQVFKDERALLERLGGFINDT